MQKLHIIFLFSLIWSFSFSQEYTNFSTKNGLPSNHVYRVTQDKQGFIWMITDKGIVKYNGTKFKTFTTKEGLPTNDIWDFRITDDNKFWYFSKAAKLGYIQNDSVYAFESSQKGEILYPIVIRTSKNKVIFSNNLNAYQLIDNHWKRKKITLKNKLIEPILHSKVDYLLNYKDSVTIIDKQSNKLKSFNSRFYYKVRHHRTQINDSLFCWVSNAVYSLLNLNTLKLVSKKYKNQLTFSNTKLVRINSANNQIQFSGQDFVSVLDKNYNLSNTVYIPKHLKSHFSFIDKNNNLWIATFNKGVYFIPASKRTSKTYLSEEKVGKIKRVNNKLIANVYNKGFYQYNATTQAFLPYLKEKGFMFSANYIEPLKQEFYLTNTKILKFNKGKKELVKHNEYYKKEINDLAREVIYYNSYYYTYSSAGLYKLDTNFAILKEYNQNGIRDITIVNNKLLIATSNGIKKLKNDVIVTVFKGQKLNYPITNIGVINSNNIVVCTDGFGAYITNFNKVELLEQSNYLSVQSAYVKNNNIWLATTQGIWHYQKNNKKAAYKLIYKYTVKDGLSDNIINDVIIVDNTILATTNIGINAIPINQQNNNTLIQIYTDEVQHNNKIIHNNKNLKYTTNNHTSFTVATIDYSKNNQLKYKYQLLPVQPQWKTTTSNQLVFNNLYPNQYQLNIKQLDKTTTFSFNILPLWYQTNIFKLVTLLLGLFSFYFFYRWNSKRIQKKTQEKLAIKQRLVEQELYALRSQMNPHFVFNSLAAIQFYINSNDYEASEEYLVKFSRLIRRFFELSKEKEISLSEEITLLYNYLEIEKLRFKEKLSYTFNIDKNLNTDLIKIPTMLLQPIVENAVNHGIFNKLENGLITINFNKISQNSYQVEIIDDGVGVDNTVKKTSKKKNSSMVLRERLRYLNEHQNWKIEYFAQVLHPSKKDKGNISKFTITYL